MPSCNQIAQLPTIPAQTRQVNRRQLAVAVFGFPDPMLPMSLNGGGLIGRREDGKEPWVLPGPGCQSQIPDPAHPSLPRNGA